MFKILLALCVSVNAMAYSVKIVKILSPSEYSSDYTVFASDGFVYDVPVRNAEALDRLEKARENGSLVDLNFEKSVFKTLKSRDTIKSVELREAVVNTDYAVFAENNTPTTLDGFDVAKTSRMSSVNEMFKTMKKNFHKNSQCYNRAHVWAHRISNTFLPGKKLNIGKAWVFFSDRYVEKFKFKWWFHIAPYINFRKDNGRVLEPMVLDRTYLKGARTLRRWTDFYMKNDAKCHHMKRYSEFVSDDAKAWCYTMFSSQYYWQPFEMSNLDQGTAEAKTRWIRKELEFAIYNVRTGKLKEE